MKLTQEQIDQINVTVDSFEQSSEDDIIDCSCVIADNDTENRVVTFQEIKDYLNCDSNGNVFVTDMYDTQEGQDIPFEYWWECNVNTIEFLSDLENIINARENRKPLYRVVDMPTATDILNAIKDCK